jgi:hypothetical protein
MATQPPLFDNATPTSHSTERTPTRGLTVAAQGNRPLTKTQKTFNRLVAKVEQLRARVEADTQRFDAALVFHAQHLRHRVEATAAIRANVVRALAPYLDDKRLKQGDTQVLRRILVYQLDEVLAVTDAVDDDLKAIFERVHGSNMNAAEEAQLQEARADMEAMFAQMGIDVDLSGLRPGMSPEDAAAHAAHLIDEVDRQTGEAESRTPPNQRKTKRELREEERQRRADDARKISLGSIYRQLAKVLHPDLEPDPVHRQRKSVLMQDLTAAYSQQDLHTLLRLQLEWIRGDDDNASQLADERLEAYNLVLKEQVAQLEWELAELPLHPKYDPLIEDLGPYGVRVRTDGPAEVQRLDALAQDLQGALDSLNDPRALTRVRRLIRQQRAADKLPRLFRPR